jgi:pyridoxine 5-phosphate synthase
VTKLSVNVNKIATLRNTRGGHIPDVTKVTRDILSFGAHGITVHPRPDGRHIKKQDVFDINSLIQTWNQSSPSDEKREFNVEGYPSEDFLELIADVRPDQCTLVPDPPDVLTSNAGWDVKSNFNQLTQVVGQLRQWGVRSSVFFDPFDFNREQSQALLEVHPDRVELFTGRYAESFDQEESKDVLEKYKNIAIELYDLDIAVNAGHDLNQKNLLPFVKAIPVIDEVSIGHALICEALYDGLEHVVQAYLNILASHESLS